jgi:response regulator RpfG family c-di-GMP phosphodiesterase
MADAGEGVRRELEEGVADEAGRAGMGTEAWHGFMGLLAPLAEHNIETYLHCLRVGIYAARLAAEGSEVHPSLALFGGTAHDIGKLGIPNSVLRADPFGAQERRVITGHAIAGFLRLRLTHYEAALVAGLHHAFQSDPYGLDLAESFSALVVAAAKMVSICDFFDAFLTRRDRRYAEDERNVGAARHVLEDNFPESPRWAAWLVQHPLVA